MVNESELLNLIQEAKKTDKERKFKQALELYLVFKDIDVKKGFALNEVIQLPKKMAKPSNKTLLLKLSFILKKPK